MQKIAIRTVRTLLFLEEECTVLSRAITSTDNPLIVNKIGQTLNKIMIYKYGQSGLYFIGKGDVSGERWSFLVFVAEAVLVGRDFVDMPVLP